MARPRRIHRPGGFYHVTLRGNHQQDIFHTADDRRRLESLLAHASRELGTRIHAYCWMTNHIHVVAEVGDAPLGALVRRVATPYAREWHRRLGTTGHLFARRHFARLVDTERDLLTVIRYTHYNPVRGGLVQRPGDYPWSSHRAYLGKVDHPWLTTSCALAMLGATEADARRAYRRYMNEAEGIALPSPFAADLNRQIRAGRRVNGGDPPGTDPPRGPLDEIIAEVCRDRGITIDEAKSGSSARRFTVARVEIARRATEGGLASLSQVARALGRSPSALTQWMQRHHDGTAREIQSLPSPRRVKSRRPPSKP